MVSSRTGICFVLAVVFVMINGDVSEPHLAGSVPATINEFPYQLSLRSQDKYRCNAAIISEKWAITTASCFGYYYPFKFSVRAGSAQRENGGAVHLVSRIFTHPQYNEETLDFDVALFNVTKPFVFSNGVRSIPLAARFEYVPNNMMAVVSGWGNVTASKVSTDLRKLSLPTVNQMTCMSLFNGLYTITRNMLCAGYTTPSNKGVCDAAGAPLVGRGKLIGIASWGIGCATGVYPHVFTRLSAVRTWITSITGLYE